VTAAASLLLSILTAILAYVTRTRSDRRLAVLNDQLANMRATRDAQLDYEYEARKRLYTEFQPLLFLLVESCESAYFRICGLAQAARQGNLGPRQQSWLHESNYEFRQYYLLSTVHRLMAPLVTFRLSQRRLTLVDLSVDREVYYQYILSKQLYLSWTQSYQLAQAEPSVQYDPIAGELDNLAKRDPAIYSWQDLTVGNLDQIIAALTVVEGDNNPRCMTYGEFEAAFQEPGSKANRCSSSLVELFLDFHPRKKPVLWRILVTQAHLHKALMAAYNPSSSPPTHPLDALSPQEHEGLDWRQSEMEASHDEAIETPIKAARSYLSALPPP
jgi:hypothetical protein